MDTGILNERRRCRRELYKEKKRLKEMAHGMKNVCHDLKTSNPPVLNVAQYAYHDVNTNSSSKIITNPIANSTTNLAVNIITDNFAPSATPLSSTNASGCKTSISATHLASTDASVSNTNIFATPLASTDASGSDTSISQGFNSATNAEYYSDSTAHIYDPNNTISPNCELDCNAITLCDFDAYAEDVTINLNPIDNNGYKMNSKPNDLPKINIACAEPMVEVNEVMAKMSPTDLRRKRRRELYAEKHFFRQKVGNVKKKGVMGITEEILVNESTVGCRLDLCADSRSDGERIDYDNGQMVDANKRTQDHASILGISKLDFCSGVDRTVESLPVVPQAVNGIHVSAIGVKECGTLTGHVPNVVSKKQRTKLKKTKLRQISHLEKIPLGPHVLRPSKICSHCGARKFEHESKGFCCSNGDVILSANDIPDELHDLFTSTSDEAQAFKTYIRAYNCNFAFTSLGVNYDKSLCGVDKGIYIFRVQGQIYHYVNELIPTGQPPSFLQLYFHDTEHELENRLNFSDNMTAAMTKKIIELLKVNPYCQFFRNLKDLPNLERHKIHIKCDPGLDQRVYNAPTVSQVAAIWVDGNPSTECHIRDIVVSGHSGESHRIHYCYGCYDPLQYPLLFPYGDPGWHLNISKVKQRRSCSTSRDDDAISIHEISSVVELLERETSILEGKNERRSVTCRKYYCYRLQIRPLQKSILLHAGRLLQQYVVDMYVKVETARLNYLRQHQVEIRADLYRGILDTLEMGETRGSKSGKRVVLPASFIGSPRDMRKRYMDAMALVQRFGKPDLFITITCNPNWQEIRQELGPNDAVQNRPDLVSRIFRAKLEELKNDLFKKQIFGRVAAYVYVIEFQKRGLPHAHLLVILKPGAKLVDPEKFDEVVSAEIPSEKEESYLHSLVAKHMMHDPCGALNSKNVCMQKNGKCRSYYPKSFCSDTSYGEDSYPNYRRRNDGRRIKVRGHCLDNRWVVPYNPYLLAKFDCHINVEVCSTIKAVKYLYKYVYKGHDRVCFSVRPNDVSCDINEIDMFQSGRWISPPEAMWRLFGFILSEVHPSVVPLQLHLPDDQLVTFRDTDDLAVVVNSDFAKNSMLTGFFRLNSTSEKARTLLYKEFPEYFVWNKQSKSWTERKKHAVIGRLVLANPVEGERYYLRLLLCHIRGATSYHHLKMVNGVYASSFREAAVLHGLLEGDNSCEICLEEASLYGMPFELRRLFATVLALCTSGDPKMLWEKFKGMMCQDYVHEKLMLADAELRALQNINSILETMGKSVNDYGLVSYRVDLNLSETVAKVIDEELQIIVSDYDLLASKNLNDQQKYAFHLIMEKVSINKGGMFFIDGPGGTGKTYLYRALLAAVCSKKIVALATTSSGVAAGLLPGGRTTHSRFKIPLQIDESATCSVSKQSGLATLLRIAKLIIWDEAPMVHRHAIEALDRMLQDVNECDLPFGGKVVVLGGDFHQVLPVVLHGTKNDVIKASLVNSYLWKSFTRIQLVENMRAKSDPMFSEYLLQIGNGEEECDSLGKIQLPANMVLPFNDEVSSMKQLIDIVFPHIDSYPHQLQTMINRVILTPKNDYVDQINDLLLQRFPGDVIKYYSFDEVVDKTDQSLQKDFLNTLTPNGIPPHELTLKKHCPVMLLRNINAAKGLCNGTRLICLDFGRNVIHAEIAVGEYSGKKVFLPRIPFMPLEKNMDPFAFKRTQFPIRPCFAMTINKAQGQTLDFVGLYLPEPVFSHGQLYVALSRARTSHCIKILMKTGSDDCPTAVPKMLSMMRFWLWQIHRLRQVNLPFWNQWGNQLSLMQSAMLMSRDTNARQLWKFRLQDYWELFENKNLVTKQSNELRPEAPRLT